MQLRRVEIEVALVQASQATAVITSQLAAPLEYDRQALLSAYSAIALMSSHMSLRLVCGAYELEAGLSQPLCLSKFPETGYHV
jgi:hypothetical protein